MRSAAKRRVRGCDPRTLQRAQFRMNHLCLPGVWDAMQRQPVISTSISSVGYDRATRVVEVEFVGGGVYRYSPVPVYVYRELLDAPSKGVYVNTVLKPRYKSEGPLK